MLALEAYLTRSSSLAEFLEWESLESCSSQAEIPDSRKNADAIEPVACRQRVEFAGGVAGCGHVARRGGPIRGVHDGVELQPIGDVGSGRPREQGIRAEDLWSQQHGLRNRKNISDAEDHRSRRVAQQHRDPV